MGRLLIMSGRLVHLGVYACGALVSSLHSPLSDWGTFDVITRCLRNCVCRI